MRSTPQYLSRLTIRPNEIRVTLSNQALATAVLGLAIVRAARVIHRRRLKRHALESLRARHLHPRGRRHSTRRADTAQTVHQRGELADRILRITREKGEIAIPREWAHRWPVQREATEDQEHDG